ncbi:stalk domain-containing protein [Paenibacillus filicis]|uniref:Stalk domain-containing protein n=1 Tax=Paenibacillus gyeongsangnamensis TaxID=3388067 RepID=A0ABT4QH02_9BACL|nr:stalk domain-containing protein [Paenibacillus filicis]MCZ8515965.1 stalk domain-containing protein [Paenibacillus filicis]
MNKNLWISSLLLLTLAGGRTASADITGATVTLELADGQKQAKVNGQPEALETPGVIVDGSFYVPLAWVSEKLGLKAVWHADRQTAGLKAPKAYLEWDLGLDRATINGAAAPLSESAMIADGRFLVKLSRLAPYLNVEFTYEAEQRAVRIRSVSPTGSLYKESNYPGDQEPNSRPVARFMPDKPSYRVGEPVHLIDLSYDPNAEGLPDYEWSGKQEAYFTPGTYEVTLRVKDGHGAVSDPYTRTITVRPEPYLTQAEYPWYFAGTGELIPDPAGRMGAKWEQASQLQAAIRQPEDRRLVVGADGKRITSNGMVYRDRLQGKARLYGYAVNGMGERTRWGIAVTNPSPERSIKVTVTREGKLAPSLFAQSSAAQAGGDYLNDRGEGRALEVPAGATVWLSFDVLEPGQGTAILADVTASGEAVYVFGSVKPDEAAEALAAGPVAAEAGSVRGTYVSADHVWEAAAGEDVFRELKKWSIGGTGTLEPRVAGKDGLSGEAKSAASAKGSVYKLRLNHPRAAAVALRAVNGVFYGTVKVNGVLMTPPTGGLTPKDGFWLLTRTTGKEERLDMEYTPAPGSAENVEWLFYPLGDLK